jgi:hypothetical protein
MGELAVQKLAPLAAARGDRRAIARVEERRTAVERRPLELDVTVRLGDLCSFVVGEGLRAGLEKLREAHAE